jgi:hypothetical protein
MKKFVTVFLQYTLILKIHVILRDYGKFHVELLLILMLFNQKEFVR